jgi:hypothetical protein
MHVLRRPAAGKRQGTKSRREIGRGGAAGYGDFDAGWGAYVMRSVGSAFNLAETGAFGSGFGRAADTVCSAAKYF